MQRVMDIGRTSQYEEAGRQPGLRILAAIAGAQSAEQSTFMNSDVCVSRHVRLGGIKVGIYSACKRRICGHQRA